MARRLEQMEPAGRRQEARAGHSRSLSGGAPGKASVPAIERAFVILELLAHSRAGLTLRDVVRATGLPKSSAYCILTTLQRHGYLHRNERTSRYLFGLKLFSLANSALSGLPLREQAEPFLRSLMMQTRLTVHMGIKEREEVVLVAKTEPPGIFRLATWIGKRMEVHCTGLGKALLAFLPEEEVDRVLQAHNLPRHNENTISSVRRLKEDLARVRTRGYAIDDEEDEIGLRCLGAPVFDGRGTPVAAVSISGNTLEIHSDNMATLAAHVLSAAHSISAVLGQPAKEASGVQTAEPNAAPSP